MLHWLRLLMSSVNGRKHTVDANKSQIVANLAVQLNRCSHLANAADALTLCSAQLATVELRAYIARRLSLLCIFQDVELECQQSLAGVDSY